LKQIIRFMRVPRQASRKIPQAGHLCCQFLIVEHLLSSLLLLMRGTCNVNHPGVPVTGWSEFCGYSRTNVR
jgi:hypothetical protein